MSELDDHGVAALPPVARAALALRFARHEAESPPPESKAMPSIRKGGRAERPRFRPASADLPAHSTAGLNRWTLRVGVTVGAFLR